MIFDTTLLFWVLCFMSVPITLLSIILLRIEWYTSKFQNVPGLPIFENYFLVSNLKGLLKEFLRLKEKYGRILKINIFTGVSCIVITDLRLIESILSTTNILGKAINYSFLKRWLGTGLLTSPGRKWRKTRNILTPAFHFQILDHYIETFHSASEILVDKFRSHVGRGAVDIYPYVTLCTLDIICESAMGTKINAQQNADSDYVNAVSELCRVFMERSTNPLKVFPLLYFFTKDFRCELKALRVVHGFTRSVIKNRKEELLKKGQQNQRRKKLAFLDLLLQSKIDDRPMTDEEIRQEVDTFMFAGHDTTATAISFILYCLSKNPDVQENVMQEIHNIFGHDNSTPAKAAELNEMKYLERVIKESLRLYPPTPFFGRCPIKDTKYYGGLFPMLSQLVIFSYGVHHDPNIYPDPERFDPDRFLPENITQRHPYSYLVFSAGPRNCIGQRFAMLEMKSTISHILRHYVVKPVSGYEPQPIPLAVLKSRNGVQIELEERTQNVNENKY